MNFENKGPAAGAAPYMPFMIELKNVLVFGGERGEGLQKTEKLSLYAEKVSVIPEGSIPENVSVWDREFVFPHGPVRYVNEDLFFHEEKTAAILPTTAGSLFNQFIHHGGQKSKWWFGLKKAKRALRGLFEGVDYVVSDLKDPIQNAMIHELCKEFGIRHTVIDTKEYSDTWFMSIVDTGPILAGISSRGNCAFYTRQLREEMEVEFQKRTPIAKALSKLRESLPRRQRWLGLKRAFASLRFLNLAKQGKEQQALDLAHSIINDCKEN